MSIKEYRTAAEARGGLLVVRHTPGVAFGDRVRIEDHSGQIRNGQVIRASNEEVLVLVFEGTDDLDLEDTWIRYPVHPIYLHAGDWYNMSRDHLIANAASTPPES